ncbi:ATP-binding protein [Psychromonas sp. psych-6C06]|uniref:AAA family ATPase n=1 Tax=Psychromonas sp. psych-6C06 TaxID=2058089 RepID=UPI000C346E56|nr:ATP-binding protein [Psychromonas sp. psych-6C06]PKF61582.1 ATP-binding protein [Psychromonas sp. psych-6C06]
MARLMMVCGPTGVGKTTYSLALCKESDAIRFSIDPWMQNLFSKDIVTLDYDWMIERVNRCYAQIWEVSEQILSLGGAVVLDLGFTTKAQRQHFVDLAKVLGVNAEVHYLHAPTEIRWQRVKKRNAEQDPSVFAFEVTNEMFEFMEPRFEIPDEQELKYGCKVST